MSPFTVTFGPWQPDLANVAYQTLQMQIPVTVPLADIQNLIYVNGKYQSINTLTAVAGTPGITNPALGAFTAIDALGDPVPIVGDTHGNSYLWSGTAWVASGLPGPYELSNTFSFAQVGSEIFALPAWTTLALGAQAGATTNLFSLYIDGASQTVTGAPFGNVLATIGQFLMMGDIQSAETQQALGVGNGTQTTFSGTMNNPPIYAGSVYVVAGTVTGTDNVNGGITGTGVSSGTINYDAASISITFSAAVASGTSVYANYCTAYRARLQWSAIGNPNSWPIPLTQAALAAQAGQDDLEYEYGPVMAISGYPLYGVVFQRNAITRASYIGGNVVFSWQTYSRNLGLIAKGAWVQVGANTYFLSDQGFFYTDGANVYPIGTAANNSAGIDGWFWANVNKAALTAIRAAYDARTRNVYFAIPTGSNTAPDTMLCFNILASQWTKAALATSIIWIDSDGFTDRIGLFDQSHNYSLLTGTPNTGYCESCDIQFADGMPRTTTQVRPILDGTTPTVTLATRNTLTASPSYTSAVAPDPFGGGYAGVIAEGLYTRVRVSSANAVSIQGAQLMTQPSGGV